MITTMPAQSPPKVIPSPVARDVYRQLLPDFPAGAIQWVLETPWQGPMRIPLEAIDTKDRAHWTASKEPQKVKLHQDLIQQGMSKPVILGALPGHDKLIILDAHHRFLAYEAMQQPPMCYVGHISPRNLEAAITAHSKQYSGQSKLNGT